MYTFVIIYIYAFSSRFLFPFALDLKAVVNEYVTLNIHLIRYVIASIRIKLLAFILRIHATPISDLNLLYEEITKFVEKDRLHIAEARDHSPHKKVDFCR